MNKLNSPPLPVVEAHDRISTAYLKSLVLVAATAIGIFLCYRMAAPFMPALAAALALAVLFTPLQRWLERKVKHHSLAAFISILMIGSIVVVPSVLLGQRLLLQAVKGSELIEKKVASGEWRRAIEAQTMLAPIVEKVEQQLNLPDTVKDLTTWLSTAAGNLVKGSVFQVIGFLLTFYLLFFFLRDGRAALQSIRALSPLSASEMSLLFSRIHDTIFATIYGTLAVASVQGILGGLMFWYLGLPAPLLWGFVMALLGVVPVLGAFLVWIPAALFLALEGNWGQALALTLWGMLVVGTIDNLLRPVLVGNRLKLHTIMAFISVVGGLIVFGPAGLIIGPVVLTITMVLLEIWTARGQAVALIIPAGSDNRSSGFIDR